MTARYAVYYVPESDAALTQHANRWLGRDLFTGADVHSRLPCPDSFDLDGITRAPRHYGFHATLKAPFELKADVYEDDLINALKDFAKGFSPFEVQLEVKALGVFVALRLAADSAHMQMLHEGCVKHFDHLRQPINDFDLQRKRKVGLSASQDQRLVEWGYPYIFEEFRFHMTLTGAIKDDDQREELVNHLASLFPSQTHTVDGVAIFKQASREQPFVVLERARFS